MLVNREWQEEPELFEAVASALEEGDFQSMAYDEHGNYGEKGYIVIKTEDGRRFSLSLSEEV